MELSLYHVVQCHIMIWSTFYMGVGEREPTIAPTTQIIVRYIGQTLRQGLGH